MRDAKRILKEATELQNFAIERAKALLEARGCDYDVYTDGADWEEGEIRINFIEKTSHDCPDRDSVTLTTIELDIEEKDWQTHLEETRAVTKMEKEKKLKELEGTRIAREKAQYERLKKMFENYP